MPILLLKCPFNSIINLIFPSIRNGKSQNLNPISIGGKGNGKGEEIPFYSTESGFIFEKCNLFLRFILQ